MQKMPNNILPGMILKILGGATLVAGFVIFQPEAAFASLVGPPGGSAGNPLVVTPGSGGTYTFTNPTSGLWYDPPFVNGFIYSVTGTTFTSVTTPPSNLGFGPVDLIVGGSNLGPIPAGGSSTGVGGASTFELLGINPVLDQGAAGFSRAYPVQLSFPGTASALIITPVPAPEPLSISLFAGALGLLAVARRSRAKD